jgi:hypothetical protein
VAFWRELIERRRREKLSVDCICERAGVSTGSFYRWLRKLGGKPAEPSGHRQGRIDFVPVRIVPEQPIQIAGIWAAGSQAAGMIEIELPGMIRLRVPSPCDPQTLRIVWGVVREGQGGSP